MDDCKDKANSIADNDWESIFNTVTDSITIHDADFNIVHINESARKMLGLQLQNRESSAKCFRYYHGADSPPSGCASCQALKTGKASTVEIFEPFLNKHLEIRALPRFRDDGHLVGVIHIVRDITERKRAEEALQQANDALEHRVAKRTEELQKEIIERKQREKALLRSEEKFRAIIDKSPISMAIANMNGIIEHINCRVVLTFGYGPTDIPDMDHWWRLTYPDATSRAKIIEQWQGLVEKAIAQRSEIEKREYQITCKDGSVKTVIIFGTIIVDKIFVMFDDITERKLTDEVLRKSREETARLAKENETIAEIGRIISSTLNIEEVYDRFAKKVREAIPFNRIVVNTINLTDYTRTIKYLSEDRSVGDRLGGIFPLAGTVTEEVMLTNSSVLINSKNIEERRRKSPNKILLRFESFSLLLVPLISNNEMVGTLAFQSVSVPSYSERDLRLAERVANQISGAIANAQLFAERNRLEKELERHNKQLEALVRERTIELQKANEQLHQGILQCQETEVLLLEQKSQTEEKARSLAELNTALKVLLKRREEDRNDLEEKVILSVQQLVMPYLNELRDNHLDAKGKTFIRFIESGLKEITAPFLTKLSINYRSLTPREIQIATMIREGKSTKDIAAFLNISISAVELNRYHLRKKLGLNNNKMNLQSFLLSLS